MVIGCGLLETHLKNLFCPAAFCGGMGGTMLWATHWCGFNPEYGNAGYAVVDIASRINAFPVKKAPGG
jgi:hypothetical protein